MAIVQAKNESIGAWNPGIQSVLPRRFLPLSTMFRPENVFTSIETAIELSDFCGLPIQQLVRARPERLVVHELLIRVSADIFVSDGTRYEDLGVNFRKIVSTILSKYIVPEMDNIVSVYDETAVEVNRRIEMELDQTIFATTVKNPVSKKGFSLAALFRSKSSNDSKSAAEPDILRHQRVVTEWIKKSKSVTNDDFSRSVYRHLSRVANAIIIKHGRLIGDKSLLVSLVSGFVCNGYGSDVIGKQIQPLIEHAAKVEGLQVLPPQLEPVIINIKGASAAGKSTMRPLQRQQTEKLGIHWHDFSLISPDIWRKYLLDYDSLGEASKYAGTLAGDELPVIDQKLDRYIRRKARRGHISHMLIDRFRFDSFAPGSGMREGSNLLTRFGHTIYLTFMVTPPEATVERAWERGLKVGRYKPVDDLLDHNIEAFKGMPVLFFTWALNKNKTVHFEFLDNSVDYGKKPRTIAFGNNDEMYLYDFKCMFDIVRYTKLNIEACCPEELYPDVDLAAGANTDFLLKCAEKLSRLNFVDRQTGLVYAAMESGKMSWVDHKLIGQMLKDDEIKAGFQAIAEDVVHHLEELTQADARAISPETFQHVMGEIN